MTAPALEMTDVSAGGEQPANLPLEPNADRLATRHAAPTANLQHGMTVKDAARVMNVSVRSVYMARELLATNRSDLVAEIDAGRMTILGALKIAKPEKYSPKPKPDAGLKALRAAWERASASERDDFVVYLAERLHTP
jgi:hypothetical protein